MGRRQAELGGGPRAHLDDALSVKLRAARKAAFLEPSKGRNTAPTGAGGTRAARSDATLDDLVAKTAQVYAGALTDHTRQSYASRWRQFERWTASRSLAALPASSATVMLWLADAVDADPPASLSTLRGRLAAVNRIHVESGFDPPGMDPGMSVLMRGLGRVVERASPSKPISALRIGELREALRAMGSVDPRMGRDRALIALTGSGVPETELSRLLWTDISFEDRSVRLHLRDRPALPASRSLRLRQSVRRDCPVAALRDWLALAGDRPEHVFTLVDAYGRRDARPIHAYNIRRIIDARLDALGSDGHAATPAEAAELLAGQPSVVLRDRVLLIVGFAGAFRRNELCLLRWRDIRPDPAGVILRLRRSKTDPAGRGTDVGIPRGRSQLTCPVGALEAWRNRMVQQLGPVWNEDIPVIVRVGRSGRVGTEGITAAVLTRVVAQRARAAGLPGHWGGRSLRAGFITTAADLDIPLDQIAQQSRHASMDSLVRYIRNDDVFRRNAADWVGM